MSKRMQLSARQRIDAYEWAIEKLKSEKTTLCYALREWVKETVKYGAWTKTVLRLFPELLTQKPKTHKSGHLWYRLYDNNARLQALENALFICKTNLTTPPPAGGEKK